MNRQVTPPKRATSPTWGPPLPCKQALRVLFVLNARMQVHCRFIMLNEVVVTFVSVSCSVGELP